MENISVELILFIVLGSVFIIDFALKGIKKSSIKKEGILKFKESLTNNPSGFISKYLQYFIERPRNTGLYILTTLFTKILIHYYAYPKTYNISSAIRRRMLKKGKRVITEEPFIYYIERLFIYDIDNPSEFILMWFISISLISFIVWQLNPYIKKR